MDAYRVLHFGCYVLFFLVEQAISGLRVKNTHCVNGPTCQSSTKNLLTNYFTQTCETCLTRRSMKLVTCVFCSAHEPGTLYVSWSVVSRPDWVQGAAPSSQERWRGVTGEKLSCSLNLH